MDEMWAKEKLREFIGFTELKTAYYEDLGSFDELAHPKEAILASAQLVEKVLDRVTPQWRRTLPADLAEEWQGHRNAAIRALAEIESAQEVAEKLGDGAPSMGADAMHPWVWDAARSLWQSGHFGEAVRTAMVKLNAELQNKVGRRDISEIALFQQAFSSDAATNSSKRLRLPGDDGGRSAASLRRGVIAIAEGCFAAIRNPYSHDVIVESNEQVSLEQLALVSLLARWVDESSVVSG